MVEWSAILGGEEPGFRGAHDGAMVVEWAA